MLIKKYEICFNGIDLSWNHGYILGQNVSSIITSLNIVGSLHRSEDTYICRKFVLNILYSNIFLMLFHGKTMSGLIWAE